VDQDRADDQVGLRQHLLIASVEEYNSRSSSRERDFELAQAVDRAVEHETRRPASRS